MQKILTLTLSFLFIFSSVFAQVPFKRVYGGNNTDRVFHLHKSKDGGYAMTGITQSFGATTGDAFILKTDGGGLFQWLKTYGGNNVDWGFHITQTNTAQYLLTGRTQSFGAGNNDVFLIKTDNSGDTLWTRTYGGASSDIGYASVVTNNNNYLILGNTMSFGAGANDIYLIKTNSQGDTIWTKTYGGTNEEEGVHLVKVSDTSYMIFGNTMSYGAGSWDMFLIKINSDGDTLWSKTYGGTLSDKLQIGQMTNNGGFIFGGKTQSFGAGGEDHYLVNVDGSGTLQWAKAYGTGNDDNLNGIQQLGTGDYGICGDWGVGSGNSDIFMARVNSAGDTIWVNRYGYGNNDFSSNLLVGWNNDFVLSGQIAVSGSGECALVKTDLQGNAAACANRTGTITVTDASTTQVNAPAPQVGGGGMLGSSSWTTVAQTPVDTVLCPACIPPIAQYSSTVNGLNVLFSDSSINATGIIWHFGDNTSSTAEDTVHSYSSGGLYDACLVAYNSCDTDTVCKTIKVTGIAEQGSQNNLTVYPNPFHQTTQLQVSPNLIRHHQGLKIEVYSVTGEQLFQQPVTRSKTQLKASNLQPGLYFYQLQDKSDRTIATGKLIVY